MSKLISHQILNNRRITLTKNLFDNHIHTKQTYTVSNMDIDHASDD